MRDKINKSARGDPWRLAAALLYARGTGSPAYAEERRTEALARSDLSDAEFWVSVQRAIMTLLTSAPDGNDRVN